MARFYVPGVPDGEWETAYEDIAARCGTVTEARDRRIRSITFMHDGTEWTAEVGHCRQGVRHRRTRGGRVDYTKPPERLTSGKTVLAIFSGPPCYLVFQEAGRSEWANPALCGEPRRVEYFDAD